MGQSISKLEQRYKQRYGIPESAKIDSTYRNNQNGVTFAMYLAQCGVIPPKKWAHDPLMADVQGNTVAMQLAYVGKVPSKIWQHNKYIVNNDYKTCQDIYILGDTRKTPKYWQHCDDLSKYLTRFCQAYGMNRNVVVNNWSNQQNGNKLTFAMFLTDQKIIPIKDFYHDPSIQDDKGRTVAMLLHLKQINPPKLWWHNPETYDIDRRTVAIHLAMRGEICSKEWNHNPEMKDSDGYTVAYYLAKKGIVPPKQWAHQPDKKFDDEQTIAMILVKQDIQPPSWWVHDPNIQNGNGYTVPMYIMESKSLKMQSCWLVDYKPQLQNKINGDTLALIYARLGKVPPKSIEHDPRIQNRNGFTVAHFLAYNKITPQKQWEFKELIRNFEGSTVAMLLAYNGIIPRGVWLHEPTDYFVHQESNGQMIRRTVAMLLASNKIRSIPEEWEHSLYLVDESNRTVRDIYADKRVKIPLIWSYTQEMYERRIERQQGKFGVQQMGQPQMQQMQQQLPPEPVFVANQNNSMSVNHENSTSQQPDNLIPAQIL